MRLNISLRGLALTNTKTGHTMFQRPYRQMRAILQPRNSTNELVLDFCEYGGTVKLIFQPHVINKTINNLITGVIAAHIEWMNCPGVLPAAY